jgi:hypothetical protein
MTPRQETAALRDFGAAFVGLGSISTFSADATRRFSINVRSASNSDQIIASQRNVATCHKMG